MGNCPSLYDKSIDDDNYVEEREKLDELTFSRCLLVRIIVLSVVLIAIIQIIVYFTFDDLMQPVRKRAVITQKGLTVDCSPEYLKKFAKYEGCAPKDCTRFVTDKVISTKEVDNLLDMAIYFFKFGFPVGGKSKFDLHSGFLSKELYFVNLYGMEETRLAITEIDIMTFSLVKEKIKSAVANHFGIQCTNLYMTNPIFFSEIKPKKAATFHDDWHPRRDNESDHVVHYSTILYLSDYNIDFQGGRLIFNDNKNNSRVEPKRNRLCMFMSGEGNAHHDEEVTWGARYAMEMSFTCDEKYAIPDPDVNNYFK